MLDGKSSSRGLLSVWVGGLLPVCAQEEGLTTAALLLDAYFFT